MQNVSQIQELYTSDDVEKICKKNAVIFIYRNGCPWCEKFSPVFSRLAYTSDGHYNCFKVEADSSAKKRIDRYCKEPTSVYPTVVVFCASKCSKGSSKIPKVTHHLLGTHTYADVLKAAKNACERV